jgi:D-alanyl-D-alanine carboxypeptidase (penicillin-binding protein 5/6)
MQETGKRHAMFRQIAIGFGSVIMTATLVAPVTPSIALADVQDSDMIYGKSISERNLNHEQAPNIFAPSAALIDTDGNVYFTRNGDEERKIASTTKLMTALIAVENGSPDDIVTVTDQDDQQHVIGSTAQLLAGDQLTLDHALYGLMLPSGNDASMAIARTIGARFASEGSDPYVAFIDKMNSRAQELGMNHTVFRNPSGLDVEEWSGDQHSSANDLATLMKA